MRCIMHVGPERAPARTPAPGESFQEIHRARIEHFRGRVARVCTRCYVHFVQSAGLPTVQRYCSSECRNEAKHARECQARRARQLPS